MKKNDSIQELRIKEREQAINFAKSWIDSEMNKYSEPVRAGTPKGDPIGLSRVKYNAALLHVLYPTIKIKGIAEMVGVSNGVLMVWRTEEIFKEAINRACLDLGKKIAQSIEIIIQKKEIDLIKASGETLSVGGVDVTYTEMMGTAIFLESEVERVCNNLKRNNVYKKDLSPADNIKEILRGKFKKIRVMNEHSIPVKLNLGFKDGFVDPIGLVRALISYLPFLAGNVGTPVVESISNHLGKGVIGFETVALLFHEVLFVTDTASQRDWHRKPAMMEVAKTYISLLIDLVASPDAVEIHGGEKPLEKAVKDLKAFIFSKLDILAG